MPKGRKKENRIKKNQEEKGRGSHTISFKKRKVGDNLSQNTQRTSSVRVKRGNPASFILGGRGECLEVEKPPSERNVFH